MLLLLYKYHLVTIIICILKFVCQCYVSAFITTVNLPPLSAVRAEVKVGIGSFPGFPALSLSPLNSNQPSTRLFILRSQQIQKKKIAKKKNLKKKNCKKKNLQKKIIEFLIFFILLLII